MKNAPFHARTALLLLFSLFCYAAQAQFNCPFMRVSVASDGWVACDNSVVQIRVCNEGTQSAGNVILLVRIPQEFGFISSSPAPLNPASKVLRYPMGSVAAGDCRTISLTLAVPCAAQPGEAFCINASALASLCPASAPGWDGSTLKVEGYCKAPDSAGFKIYNIGVNPTSSGPGYVIIEDHLIRSVNNLPPIILAGDSTTVSIYNPDGSTYTFQGEQTPGHPFPEPISVSVEGCGANPGSTGYLLQYPQYNGDVHSDIFCDVVTAGINGYEKKGFPLGYGTQHLIDRRTTLNYRLRFQNTGNSAVQTVTLIDTLSPDLNLSTFRAGAASHPYTFSIQNQVLTIVFSGLNLPPSAVNAPASRGFFSFNIGVSDDAASNALIENTAFISLNSGTPITTETTFHRLGKNFISVDVVDYQSNSNFSIQVIPNPVESSARFVFSGVEEGESIVLQLSDVSGRVLRRLETTDESLYFERGNLEAGIYFFTVQHKNGRRISGKMVLR